jgi:hypothetical protein
MIGSNDEHDGPPQLSDVVDEEGNLRESRTVQDVVEVCNGTQSTQIMLKSKIYRLR